MKSRKRSTGLFLARLSPVAGACAALLLFSQCATHCPRETGPPIDSNGFAGPIPFRPASPGAPEYPVWHTKPAGGPPVLLLHALPGLTPDTVRLAEAMETWGYRVYLPSLFGDKLGNADAFGADDVLAANRFLKKSPRWEVRDRSDPGAILDDVRKMARWVSRREGGEKVIVIGNCLTGSFPLALLNESKVDTVVLAQPATPMKDLEHIFLFIPQKPEIAGSLAVPEDDLSCAIAAMERHPQKRVIGFHYLNDPLAPIEKFDTLRERLAARGLADRFQSFVLAPCHRIDQSEAERWTEIDRTRQWRTFIKPHTTIITGANRDDRNWFRSRLKTALDN